MIIMLLLTAGDTPMILKEDGHVPIIHLIQYTPKHLCWLISGARSISVPDEGACLLFKYYTHGKDTVLHVTTNTFNASEDNEGIVEKLFTTETQSNAYKTIKIPLKGNQDIDIGFIGMAKDGQTLISSISIYKGKCDYQP